MTRIQAIKLCRELDGLRFKLDVLHMKDEKEVERAIHTIEQAVHQIMRTCDE